MFPNLELEMRKAKIKRKDIADFLQVRPATITEWLNGNRNFESALSVTNAAKIQTKFFPDKELEYLFKVI